MKIIQYISIYFILVCLISCHSREELTYEMVQLNQYDSILPRECKVAEFSKAELNRSLHILEAYLEGYNETAYALFKDKKKYSPERNVDRRYFVIDLPAYKLELLPLLRNNAKEVWIKGYMFDPVAAEQDLVCNKARKFYFDAKVSLTKDSVYQFFHNDPALWYDNNNPWSLVWSDDFSAPQLNQKEWIPLERGENYNNEKQAFTSGNVLVDSGMLKLIAKREKWKGPKTIASKEIVEREYTSGEVRTLHSWTYGKFVARMKCVDLKGVISAFWMTTGREVWPPEIDITEVLGNDPTVVYFSTHYGEMSAHKMDNGSFKGSNCAEDFHEFALEWEPDALRWYVDGQKCYESKENIPSEPFYLRLSLPVGPDWSGNPDLSANFPCELSVDWVKVYQRCGKR